MGLIPANYIKRAATNFRMVYPGESYPHVRLNQGQGLILSASTGTLINFKTGASQAVTFYYAANVTSFKGGATSADDLVMYANSVDSDKITIEGAGNIKFEPNGFMQFGSYTGGAATDSTGYITIKDIGGTTRKLMVQA
jgi:hypothetical protein